MTTEAVNSQYHPRPDLNCYPVMCCNCCEPFSPTSDSTGISGSDPQKIRKPVYELSRNSEMIKVSTILEKIYRLGLLRESPDDNDKLEKDIPVCSNCASALSQMDLMYQELEKVRRFDSYLALKLAKLDEMIQGRLESSNEPNDCRPESMISSDIVEVKLEPVDTDDDEDPSENLMPPVQLKEVRIRLTPTKLKTKFQRSESSSEGLHCEDNSSQGIVGSDFADDNISESPVGGLNIREKRRQPRKRYYQSSDSEFEEFIEAIPSTSKKKKTNSGSQMAKEERTTERVKRDLKIQNVEKEPRPYGRTQWFYRRKLSHPYPCRYCNEDFDVDADRVTHLQDKHCTKSKSVICSVCGKLFANEYWKKYHEPKCEVVPSRYHLPPFICKDCGKEFESMTILRTHSQYVHSTERPFSCDLCDYTAKSRSSLNTHKKTAHHQASNVQCPQCPKVLKNQSALASHIKRMHTEEGHARYVERRQINYAKNKQVTKEKQATYTTFCKDCNVDFFTVLRWLQHRYKAHDDTSKWQCEQCGKRLTSKKLLDRHRRYVHTDERPYVCEQCGSRYKTATHLRNHISQLHTEGGKEKWRAYYRMNYKRKKQVTKELSKLDQKPPEETTEEGD